MTLGAIPQADAGPGEPGEEEPEDPAVTAAHKKLEEMQLTDDPDSIPIIPSSHEKADMLMAYSTVPGTNIPIEILLSEKQAISKAPLLEVLEFQDLFNLIFLSTINRFNLI